MLRRFLCVLGLCATPCLAQSPDPAAQEVTLPAAEGWDAHLVFDNGETGIWTVKPMQVFRQYAVPELVGLDDKGTAHVLVSYSGKWTPLDVLRDGRWLGALTQADLDPNLPGPEVYTGGALGHLHQIFGHRETVLDGRRVAHFPGRELHTVIGGELDPETPGEELLVFTRPGELHRVSFADGAFVQTRVAELEGRVRDAVRLPGTRWIATVARTGELAFLRVTGNTLERHVVYRDAMGLGRVALGRGVGDRFVLYIGHDDGRVLRLEGDAPGGANAAEWQAETIFLGPQGTRGVAVGRFFEDPEVESLAVFGYSGRVQILSRAPGEAWRAESIFTDRDRGHWLAVAELDGRNGTDELVGSGYGGRVFQLSRPVGYGRPGIAIDDGPMTAEASPRDPDTLRMAVVAGREAAELPSSLSYTGGFLPKTLVFETLVRRDDDGRIAPGLASTWEVAPDGRTVWFTLRPGARFHDGAPVDAAAVVAHFKRWMGTPEHDWLRINRDVRELRVDGERVRFDLATPFALLPELCAINPCAVMAPTSFDAQGELRTPIGSGSHRWGGVSSDGQRITLEPVEAGAPTLVLDRVEPGAGFDAVGKLLRRELDAVVDSHLLQVPRRLLDGLRRIEHVEVVQGPGSGLVHLAFPNTTGSLATPLQRNLVARAIDRAALIESVEFGAADVADRWGATHADWPRPAVMAPAVAEGPWPAPLVIRASEARWESLARALVPQLAAANIPSRFVAADAELDSPTDVLVDMTWGSPYDPELALFDAFASDPRFAALIANLRGEVTEARRLQRVGFVEDALAREVAIVPLYVPHRIGVFLRGVAQPRLGRDVYRLDFTPRD